MNLYFLPDRLRRALNNVNLNFLNEIRLRSGQPVILQYKGEYNYINDFSLTHCAVGAIITESAENVLYTAMENSVYAYSEQLKKGFITLDGGIRVGVAGTYVMQGNEVVSVKSITSLNVRIPHDIDGAAEELYGFLSKKALPSVLIFSRPGYGKTTVLRDLARNISKNTQNNVLIFDERNEIAALSGSKHCFSLGANCDVITGGNKQTAFENAVRVMRPQVIITDELYGTDLSAVEFAAGCGISVIASTHLSDKNALKNMKFDFFVELTGIAQNAVVYDKNFNFVCDCSTVGRAGSGNLG